MEDYEIKRLHSLAQSFGDYAAGCHRALMDREHPRTKLEKWKLQVSMYTHYLEQAKINVILEDLKEWKNEIRNAR